MSVTKQLDESTVTRIKTYNPPTVRRINNNTEHTIGIGHRFTSERYLQEHHGPHLMHRTGHGSAEHRSDRYHFYLLNGDRLITTYSALAMASMLPPNGYRP